jgi:hypothetical protein
MDNRRRTLNDNASLDRFGQLSLQTWRFAKMSPLSKLAFLQGLPEFLEISSSSYCSFGVKQQSLTSLLVYQTLFLVVGLLSYCDKVYSRGNINQKHRIGGVMVSVLALSAVDRGFEPGSGHIFIDISFV